MTGTSEELLRRAQVALLRESIRAPELGKDAALAAASGVVDYVRRLTVHFDNGFFGREEGDMMLVAALELWGTTRRHDPTASASEETLSRLRSAVEMAIGVAR